MLITINRVIIFEISIYELFKMQIFMKKNYLNLGLKIPYMDIFGIEF